MRRLLVLVTLVALALGGYAAADIADRVPGVLTTAEAKAARTAVPDTTGADEPPVTVPTASPADVLEGDPVGATAPTSTGLTAALREVLADPHLGRSVGITVRDGVTGEEIYGKGTTVGRVPASTAKLLTAAAVGSTLDMTDTMTTTVVQPTEGELVLVASGDTMLAPGRGRPGQTEGRAGLADLAQQVADFLGADKDAGTTVRSRLTLDTSYARGPRYAPTWDMTDVGAGYTQGVAMIGLAGQRPTPGVPSPTVPEDVVLEAFRVQLKRVGVIATVPEGAGTAKAAAPAGATEIAAVESASYRDVLALALDDSDNALTENLARQASVAAGGGTEFADSVALVRQVLQENGIDLTGVTLRDSCGLSSGQAIPVRVLGDVLGLALGEQASLPDLRDTIAALPVAGLDGTLHDRFLTPDSHDAAGIARAKTGTLTGSSGLAGTTVTRDGRPLTFAIVAGDVPDSVGTLAARAALDRVVAALTECGCR
ncbi:D-alanyl-D-alanine carboxypeptidase/D-alanyl-D-alanine-endopeptidase [Janibacter sp. G1551]|uniref:D-alanyl-D-alanine carboxypeptidase/D-alanyl-D-alanine-endopeptidase n=1 Tax=Janibacter sp. G1551 TaxID=3420440 RepID=UPI003CFFDFCE